MRIVEMTATAFGPATKGGGERHATNFAIELQKHVDVVFSAHGPGPWQRDFSETVPLPGVALRLGPIFTRTNPLPTPITPGTVLAWLKTQSHHLDFVHVHNHRTALGSLWTVATYLRKLHSRPKLILTDHNARFIPFDKALTRMFDVYAPVSAASARHLNSIAPRPTCIVPSAVTELFVSQPPPLPLSKRPIDLLFVGRLVPWKAPHRLFSIANLLSRRLARRVRAVIAGFESDPAYVDILHRSLRNDGERSTLSVVPNPSDSELLQLYRGSKLHCLPSPPQRTKSPTRSELSPATLLEAASAGTPSLVSCQDPLPEVVVNSGLGTVVSQNTDESFADSAATILSNEGAWATLSTAARDHVLAGRTYPAIVDKFLRFLREMDGAC